jgi:rhodanese-related sulfurtransferase
MMATPSTEAAAHYYQSLFSDVAGVSSRELIKESLQTSSTQSSLVPINWSLRRRRVILVDVRSKSERDVSIISGAVSLDYFKAKILPSLEAKCEDNVDVDHVDNSPLPDMVVTYCTIGFRSGLEARKLLHDYPKMFESWMAGNENSCENKKTLIGNLDGILAFANASRSLELECQNEASTDVNLSPLKPLIVDCQTNTATNRVHVYGKAWKVYLSDEYYEAITFSRIEFAWRGVMVLVRSCLSSSSKTCPCCKI